MNPTPSMTRRDVFALVTYASLGYNVLVWTLVSVDQIVLTRIPLFNSPRVSYGNNWPAVVSVIIFAVACLPFVSMIANAAGGRKAAHPVTKPEILSLVLSCIGLMLFLTSLPQLASIAYGFWQESSASRSSPPSNSHFYLRYAASMLIRLSLGFCFAFFPAIVDSLRFRMRDEQNTVS